MELYSLIISVLALIASVFTYLRHDKKLKEQERRINEYQLKQIEKEDLEGKKAAISLKAQTWMMPHSMDFGQFHTLPTMKLQYTTLVKKHLIQK